MKGSLHRRLARLGVGSWETSMVESPSCASQDGWPWREEKCSSAYMEAIIKELTREKEEGKICLGIAHHQNGAAGRGNWATGERLDEPTQKMGMMIINTNKNIPLKTRAVCLSSGGLGSVGKVLVMKSWGAKFDLRHHIQLGIEVRVSVLGRQRQGDSWISLTTITA